MKKSESQFMTRSLPPAFQYPRLSTLRLSLWEDRDLQAGIFARGYRGGQDWALESACESESLLDGLFAL